MRKGQNYLVRLTNAPKKPLVEGGWVRIRTPAESYMVSIVLGATSEWASTARICAMQDAPDPVLGRDELVYREPFGEGDSRTIVEFTPL